MVWGSYIIQNVTLRTINKNLITYLTHAECAFEGKKHIIDQNNPIILNKQQVFHDCPAHFDNCATIPLKHTHDKKKCVILSGVLFTLKQYMRVLFWWIYMASLSKTCELTLVLSKTHSAGNSMSSKKSDLHAATFAAILSS